jgi:hypothetical protein
MNKHDTAYSKGGNSMKRLKIPLGLSFVLALLFGAGLFASVAAQTVNIKIEAMSPAHLSAIGQSSLRPTSGLKVFGEKTKIYFFADTTGSGSTAVTSFAWSFVSVPASSNAVFDSSTTQGTSFTADTVGQYIVQVSVNGGAKTDVDTVFASTYTGFSYNYPGCGLCHATNANEWQGTLHSSALTLGITGQLEVDAQGNGTFSPSCIKCHTTGWDQNANNGNFGYLAHQDGWDTTWYKPYTKSGNSYKIPSGDSTALKDLQQNYSSLVPTANVGCESCHGPGGNHFGDKTKIGKSLDAGVCKQCHDSPPYHPIGSMWQQSLHASIPSASHANSTGCYPCHNGTAFVKWIGNKANPGYNTATDNLAPSISCAVCHDPHDATNPFQLRTVSVDSLMNGYKPTSGGMGQLCMNCHHSRYNVATKVTSTAPYYGFSNYYGPHQNPQADMLFGQNAYEYGEQIAGLQTHGIAVKDACVTCHMQDVGSAASPNHTWSMTDSTGNDLVGVCQNCHGASITSFDDVKAFADYDGNGVIEGVQTEIQGMLDKLKARLPLDASGNPVTSMADSLKVKNHPDTIQAIYDYYFVLNDGSMGVHNTKYAVALLRAALGGITGVKSVVENDIPKTFDLSQNYPNPFNPSTEIQFSIPRSGQVNLSVYNVLGELVATLANGEVVPGTYKVQWNAANSNGSKVASGIYFYRLVVSSNGAANYSITKKMLLLK